MRILQLIDSLSVGGAERMSVNIANTFAENDIESFLVASRKGGPLQQLLLPNVKFYCLDKTSGLNIAGFYRLVRLVKKIKPDIIHAHSSSVIWASFIRLFYSKIKLIWHDHNGMQLFKDRARSIYRYLSFLFDGVIVVNSNLLKWGKKNLKVNEENIVYLRNFTSFNIMHRAVDLSKEPMLVCLANLRPVKDQINLITALNILNSKGFHAKLELAGGFVDAEYHRAIIRVIRKYSLGNRVELLGEVNDVSALLFGADIGIISSESEGLPVALLEYGLAGLPVVCTDTGQCKQVLGNGKYGIVIPPGDPTALADAIIELVTNSAEAEQMASAFHKHVREEYGSEGFLSGYLKLVNNII